jgi:signal transduction histidine kinase
MNFKLRFALLFSFFVALILFVSNLTTYILFFNHRQEDYFQRVSKEGADVHNIYKNLKDRDESSAYRFIKEIHERTLINERLFIFDSSGTVVFRFPDTLRNTTIPFPFEKIRENGEELHYVDSDNHEQVAMYMPETQSYVFVSGYDRLGLLKLRNLKLILIFVFFAALALSALISFLFVKQAVKPLQELGAQMKRTNVQNLTERVDETNENDEVNEIAKNFNAMLERLSKSFEFQKNFVYHASHELRTPLATMLSVTESALHKELPEAEYKKILLSLKEEQQELIQLTNSLLLISQFDEMGFIDDLPNTRIDEVIYETVSVSKKILPGLNVNITFASIPENDDDFIIRGNDTLLKSAFSNLIKNGYTYSVDQTVNITLDADGKTIFIHIDNAGTQLPADEKENIMIPFFRGNNALTTKGYGLGLSMVYRFIAVHKGTITYTAISNDVNRFTVTLNKA